MNSDLSAAGAAGFQKESFVATKKAVPLVVTTKHKGVFFGYGVYAGEEITVLENARMVVYWSPDTKSVVGLAANGPSKSCRISPAVPSITIRDVTAGIVCSADAAAKFEAAPWG